MTGTSTRSGPSPTAVRALPGLQDKRLVFVGGLHKSGTSVLARCLAAHPAVSGFSDTGAPEDEGQHLQSVYPAACEHGGPGRFAFAAAAHLTERSPLATRASAQRLLAEWSTRWDTSRPVLLEKSPPNLIRMRFLQAMFPDAAFVVMVRHPAVVALATQRWTDQPLASLLEHWCRAHAILAADLPFVRRVAVVRYEQLVADPTAALRAVGRVLDLTDIPGDELQPGHDDEHVARGRTARGAAADRGLPHRFQALMALFGYRILDGLDS